MSQTKKTIWIDLLCLGSLLRVLWLVRRIPVEKVYFANHAFYFSRCLGFVARLIGRPTVQITDMSVAAERIDGKSVYEEIQDRLTRILEQWAQTPSVQEYISKTTARYGYNAVKFTEHLKEAAYPHVFRMVELNVWAECKSGAEDSLFIFRRTPVKSVADIFLPSERTSYYGTILAHYGVPQRPQYIYDSVFHKKYFSGSLGRMSALVIEQIYLLISAVLCGSSAPNHVGNDRRPRIGVELLQSRFRLEEINDLYWFKDSFIDPQLVCGLELENYDEISDRELTALGINRCKAMRYPSHWAFFLKNWKTRIHSYASISMAGWSKSSGAVLAALPQVVLGGESGWMAYQSAAFRREELFWRSICAKFSLKILWSMYDIDPAKLAKAQALESAGGFFMGSHWSNMPLYTVYNQKCYDILVTWGPHFAQHTFSHYPFLAMFPAGYPCDHYFKAHESFAKELRGRYEGKFVLAYLDNIMAEDIALNKVMQLELHAMLISLLKKFENLVVFLKPKRRFVWDEILKEMPELDQLMREGRVELFLGETSRTKVVPALVGMASDLVVGLGISTAATEAFFAGTVAFHADLTGFEGNAFADNGNGTVVFREISDLERAVVERIRGVRIRNYERYRSYYAMLDPFMDGHAAQRTGFIIKRIREYMQEGIARPLILKKISRDYDGYLASMPTLQGITLN